MSFYPAFDEFERLSREATLVPVYRELLFDTDTAVSAYAKLARAPFGFLLESVVGGETWARYTFLGTRPSGAWRLRGGALSWWTPEEGWTDVPTTDPLRDLGGPECRIRHLEHRHRFAVGVGTGRRCRHERHRAGHPEVKDHLEGVVERHDQELAAAVDAAAIRRNARSVDAAVQRAEARRKQ